MVAYEPALYDTLTMLENLALHSPCAALYDQAADVRRIIERIQLPLPASEPADKERLWFERTATQLTAHRTQISGGAQAIPDNYAGPASDMYLQEAHAALESADELIQFLNRHAQMRTQLTAHRREAINHQLTLIGTARIIATCYQTYVDSGSLDPDQFARDIAGHLAAANETMLRLTEAINLAIQDVWLIVEDAPH